VEKHGNAQTKLLILVGSIFSMLSFQRVSLWKKRLLWRTLDVY
jgi:hypothetical protein